jgi:WD40 repeat protein
MTTAERPILLTARLSQNHPNCDADVNQLVDESLHLMQRFHEPIQQSAAHVYVSAIPLTPSSNIIFKVYAPKLKSLPKLVAGDSTPAPWAEIRPRSGRATAVSYSPDRSWLAFPGGNNKLEIWDVASCYPLRAPLTGHGAMIRSITFSQDGTKFCSADFVGCILVWDATTYDAIGVPIQLPYFADQISLWADKVIASDDDCRVSLWDIAAGILVAEHELGFAPDGFTSVDLQGAYLVMRKQNRITNIAYALTGEDVTNKYTHGRDITDVTFSPDNKQVVCVYHANNCVSILNVHSGNVIGNLDVDVTNIGYARIIFSPNGRRIIALKGNHVAIHDFDTGKLMYGPFKRTYAVVGAELSLDETRLLVRDSRSFEVLDIPSGNVVAFKVHPFGNREVGISPNGNHVITSSRNVITIFDVPSLSTHTYNIGIACVAPSPTSRKLLFAMSDNTLRFAMDNSSTNFIVLDDARSPAAFSPEGSTIASAYIDHTLQLWDTKDGKTIGKPLEGHRKVVTAIAFSPTGSRLISASDDNTIRIWSAAAGGGELLRLQAYNDIRSISLSSDESRIVCVSNRGIIHTLNASTGFATRQPSPSEWRWAELLPGSKEIFYVSVDGQTRLVECQTGRVTEHSTSLPTRRITNAVFSPQRTHVISISETDFIDFSDLTTSHDPSSTACSHPYQWLIFSSNGRWLVSVIATHFPSVHMWDSKSGQLLWEYLSDDDYLPTVTFSHSGNIVAIWSSSVCLIRNTLLGTIVSRWRTESAAKFVTFSPDEKQIICVLKESNISETWDIECGTMVDSSQDANDSYSAVPSVEPGVSRRISYKNALGSDLWVTAHIRDDGPASAVSPDGTRLATAHKRWTLTLRDMANGTDKVVFEILDSPMCLPTFSLDGSKFALVVADMSIYIWDTITGHLLGKSQKHQAVIRSLALSPDGAQIVSICGHSSEATAQTWQVGEDLGIIFDTYKDPPESAAFFPDGARFITTSESGTIRVWDITPTTPLSVLKPILRRFESTNIAISSDGTRLISDCRLWDIINCQVLKSLNASIAKFSPDGTRVALTSSNDVQILDAITGAILYQRSGFVFIGDMSFSLDSTRLFYWNFNGTVRIMDLRHLPTSVNTEVLSCVYPPDCMMIEPSQHDGWYRATNGARLIWLPQDMQPVWLATSGEPSGSRCLILGSTNGLAILDMEDYLEVPPVGAAWRQGGTRYMRTAWQASAQMSESGSTVWLFRLFALFIPR